MQLQSINKTRNPRTSTKPIAILANPVPSFLNYLTRHPIRGRGPAPRQIRSRSGVGIRCQIVEKNVSSRSVEEYFGFTTRRGWLL